MTLLKWLCFAWGITGALFVAVIAIRWVQMPTSQEIADANDRAIKAQQRGDRLMAQNVHLAAENARLREEMNMMLEERIL